MTTSQHSLWVEKYRPTDLDGYLGNDHVSQKVKRFIEEQDIPHLLFAGRAGTGKTTLAKLLIKNINCDYLFINASDENGIDTIRNKIKGFITTISLNGMKIVVLDECLDENTIVWVLRSSKEVGIAIKDLDPKNDLVKSWNVNKSRIEWKPFEKFDKGLQDVYEIEFENGEVVVCTEDHKWYVSENDNVKVVLTKDLHIYNHILSPM